MAHKSDTATVIKDIIEQLENLSGHRLQHLRCDNGSEYVNANLAAYCADKGIKMETTVRYTPEQNGAAERLNRTLMDKVRPMLAGTGLPKFLWAEAVTTASYVRNRSPVTGRDKTPWELFFGTKPDVSHLRTFGARCYAHTPKALRHKLDNTSAPGRFIGYPPGTKGYKILLENGRIIISRDVKFLESSSGQQPPPVDDTDTLEPPENLDPVGAEEAADDLMLPPPADSAGTSARPPTPRKQPKRTATDVPASVWGSEGYQITGRKRG